MNLTDEQIKHINEMAPKWEEWRKGVEQYNRCLSALEILRAEGERIRILTHNTHVSMAETHKALEDSGCDHLLSWCEALYGPRQYYLESGRLQEKTKIGKVQ